MNDTRFVVAKWEYMDGTQAVIVDEPSEYHETARRIPAKAIQDYEDAQAHLYKMQEALMAAWGDADDEPNPKYEETP